MKFDQSMIKILHSELAEWVLADELAEIEEHPVEFIDLPTGLSVEFLPDGICVAMRVFEEVRNLLANRPGRRPLLAIQLQLGLDWPEGVPRTRQEVEARLDWTPPSIYVHDMAEPTEWGPGLVLVEEVDVLPLFEGCTVVGQDLHAKYAVAKDKVAWESGFEYRPTIYVGEAKWLPADRDLRSA